VAGSCKYGDEPSDSGATELVTVDTWLFNVTFRNLDLFPS
jgi:hypothetical protein